MPKDKCSCLNFASPHTFYKTEKEKENNIATAGKDVEEGGPKRSAAGEVPLLSPQNIRSRSVTNSKALIALCYS